MPVQLLPAAFLSLFNSTQHIRDSLNSVLKMFSVSRLAGVLRVNGIRGQQCYQFNRNSQGQSICCLSMLDRFLDVKHLYPEPVIARFVLGISSFKVVVPH